jgi:hypothetical protein
MGEGTDQQLALAEGVAQRGFEFGVLAVDSGQFHGLTLD